MHPQNIQLIPTGFPQYGSNPTGMTSTLERRLQVLELAREHNFLILEGRL